MKRDSLGLIFKVEKQLGRGDIFEVIADFADGSQQKIQFHHEHYDGLGALLECSKIWTGEPLQLPLFNLKSKDPFAQMASSVRGFWDDLKPRTTAWNSIQPQTTYSPEHLARHVFTPAETQNIIAAARGQNVSLSVFLLWHVNATVSAHLLSPEQRECHWLLPVNMRRRHSETSCSANRTSSVGLHFKRTDSLQSLSQVYQNSLNPWHARANETLAHAAALLGEKALLSLARARGERNAWIGSFTNLGNWNFPALPAGAHWPVSISIAPPAGTPCFPVGVGMVTWQGRLAVSLRLHAALCTQDAALPEKLLNEVTSQCVNFSSSQSMPSAPSDAHQ
ncbi:MAG: hypothetical protein RIR26_757 [Pseudomonadota bacterium]